MDSGESLLTFLCLAHIDFCQPERTLLPRKRLPKFQRHKQFVSFLFPSCITVNASHVPFTTSHKAYQLDNEKGGSTVIFTVSLESTMSVGRTLISTQDQNYDDCCHLTHQIFLPSVGPY